MDQQMYHNENLEVRKLVSVAITATPLENVALLMREVRDCFHEYTS
jgi:hypothetical protein